MRTTKEKEDYRSEQQAKAQIESIVEMVAALEEASNSNDDDAREEAHQTIQEDPLSVQVRGDWHTPGDSEGCKASEFEILLCTGGPACRLIGELDENLQPDRVRIQHQDWGTPWTEYFPSSDEQADLLTYAQQFYYGE